MGEWDIIPRGLEELLKDFTLAVIREQPSDLRSYAADFFVRERDKSQAKKVPMYIIVDDDEAGEPEPEQITRKSSKNAHARRRSVAAERYDPEADDDDDDDKVIHPKTDEQRKRLYDAISGILLFRSLGTEQKQDVIDAMFTREADEGDVIIQEGDDGDNFYIIESGLYHICKKIEGTEKKLAELKDNGSFGELALMYNMPRSATVKAAGPGLLWAMDRKSFRRIVVKAAHRKRKLYETMLQQVRVNGSALVASLTEYERMNLTDALIPRSYKPQEVIIKQGDEADGMYFLESGTVSVVIESEASKREVARLEKHKYFGELGLINSAPRSATVMALDEVRVAFLERGSFERLLGPAVGFLKQEAKQYTGQ